MKAQQASASRRRQQIADHVVGRQSASVAELARLCRVSEMTIYRDLEELERQGVVRKFRGGVTAQPSAVFESNVSYRLASMREEKQAIARKAAALVEPGMSVMFDDATTTLELARLVTDVTPLTVATNYLEIIKLLSGSSGIDLVALGGNYDPTHDSFHGVQCVAAVEAMRVDAVFMSVSAVSEGHAFHQEQHVVAVKQAMLGVARQRVLLVDHSKLDRYALHRLAPLDQFDTVIIDRGLSDGIRRDLDDRAVPYQLA